MRGLFTVELHASQLGFIELGCDKEFHDFWPLAHQAQPLAIAADRVVLLAFEVSLSKKNQHFDMKRFLERG